MKILGKIGTDKFITEVSIYEIANICGYNSSSGMKTQPDVGDTVKVSDLYRALSVSRERKKEIENLADELRNVAGRVDSINQALAEPIIEVKSN